MLGWKNGQPFSERYGDVYFSADSGLEETHHVFLRGNDLAARFAALPDGGHFCIGETGFGTGLNFLCTWQLFMQCAPAGASLDFFSVEKFPLDDAGLRAALALWPTLSEEAGRLLERWRRRVPGWNRWHFADGRVRLTLAIEDVAAALPQLPTGSVAAWFLDGFAPAKNPEMWSEAVMAGIARASSCGATLATYTSAGWVRRGLQQAGFAVERVPGFGRKREMIIGRLLAKQTAASCTPARPGTALVIGGGLAGCAAAHALAQRGLEVMLLEKATRLADAASGNPYGILHARFGAGMHALHRFVLAAYGHALALLDEVLPVDGIHRAECGLLQLAATEQERVRITKLAAQDWPPHLLQAVGREQAGRLAGLPMEHGGLWFPAGGWVVPPQLCQALIRHPNIKVHLNHAVTGLERHADGWRVSGLDFSLTAEHVVVCSAHQARQLAPFADFPLQPVRGQISLLEATSASCALKAVLCAEGYCTPPLAGQHVAGATSRFDDDGLDIRMADHADNLDRIREHMPTLWKALGAAKVVEGRAGVRCSVPGATPLVGKAGEGLYCSLAHGTRGLITTGLAAEVIASAMCDTLPPLPQQVLRALAPVRRLRNRGQYQESSH